LKDAMPDLFISYARGDSKDFVALLSGALEQRGKDTWVDLDDIPPASSWNDDLRSGIATSDSFCFVISPASVASAHCRSEVEHAVALGKRILPVLHQPVPDGEVPEAVATRNWIPQLGRFTDDFDTSVATLVTAIETDLDWVREHTRWGLRAEEWERRGADRSLLARGSDLDQAEAFFGGAAGREPAPTELQGRYVVASRHAATRRQRQLFAGVSIALVVSIVFGVLALLQRNTAVEQKHEAEKQRAEATSRALAANAFLNLPTDPELSVLLGLEAAKASPTSEAESALRGGILDDRLRATLRHDGNVYDASFSPDGTRVVTTSEDQTAALWDARSGHKVADLSGATSAVFEARWSSDGRRVVTQATDGTARVWDGRTGAPVSIITDTDDPRLSDVAITSDGSIVITSGFIANKVRVWNAADGSLLGTVPRTSVDRLALSPDDSLLAIAQLRRLEVWSLPDLRRLATYPRGEGETSVLAFSPNGQLLLYANQDGSATVRSSDGSVAAEVHHDAGIDSATFSPDSKLLATASEDGTARVTQLGGGFTVATYTGHEGPVRAIAFSPDGSEVASGGQDGHVDLWRTSSGARIASLVGHHARVNTVAFSADGRRVVSSSDDSTARVWTTSPSGGSIEKAASLGLGGAEEGVISDNGHYALVRVEHGDSFGVETIDLRSGETRPGFELPPTDSYVPAISPDGSLVPVGTSSGVELRRTSDGSVVSTLDTTAVAAAAFSPDGERVAVGPEVFDVASGARLSAVAAGSADSEVGGVAFSPDGDRLATASTGGTVQVWDADSGKQLRSLRAFGPPTPHSTLVLHVAFSPDGQTLLTSADWENDAHVWDLRTGQETMTLESAGGGISGVGFSPSGRFLVMSGYLGNVRLWDAKDGRLLTDVVGGEADQAEAATFSAEHTIKAIVAGARGRAELGTYTCDVCGDLDSLVELGEARVTRELTTTEKATYLSDS
jgi:WD40 repeat protein